jgi:cyclic beta-1,2-glucan synthetase
VQALSRRVQDNSNVLLAAYQSCATTLQAGQTITPATEWLLDNFHIVERQLQQISRDLPPGYYRQLPKLTTGPFAGYPRVFGIAWAYVAHTDSLMNGPILARFVRAYQTVEPLTIGELWAVAITLRIVLIENMRRLADQITAGQTDRQNADKLVETVFGHGGKVGVDLPPRHGVEALAQADAELRDCPLSEPFAARIAQRLRGFDASDTPLHSWLLERLIRQGQTVDDVIQNAQSRQGASNVTMRNIVTSMRLISEMDWPVFVENVSLVDAQLRARSDFAANDFATRDHYRASIETLARGASLSEVDVTDAALDLAGTADTPATRDPGFSLIGAGRCERRACSRCGSDHRPRCR